MLKIENLTKTYRTQHGVVTVLDRINLTIKPGEKIGILG